MTQVLIPDVEVPPALTKGVQGTTGYSTQDLKDSGRTNIQWSVDAFTTTATAEALLTVTESRDGAATTTFTSKTITNGKRLRIASLVYAIQAGGSTPAISRVVLRMRVNSAGATTTASPIQLVVPLSVIATSKTFQVIEMTLHDGIEYAGDGTRSIGFSAQSADWVTGTNTPVVYLSVNAFEY